MKYVADDKFFKLTDEELIEQIRTNRDYINSIVRQRMYFCLFAGIAIGFAFLMLVTFAGTMI